MKPNYTLIGFCKDCTLLLFRVTIIKSLDVPEEWIVGERSASFRTRGGLDSTFRCRASDDSFELSEAHFLTYIRDNGTRVVRLL